MATKSMGYDNPAYLAVHGDQGGTIAAGSGTSATTKFVSFTAAIIKSLTARIGTASATSNDYLSLVQISGTTTTTWTGANPTGSAATGYVYSTFATNPVLAQGDEYYIQKGTDATVQYAACCAERVVQPLANVTV